MSSAYRCFHCGEIVSAGETHSHAERQPASPELEAAIGRIERRMATKTHMTSATAVADLRLLIEAVRG